MSTPGRPEGERRPPGGGARSAVRGDPAGDVDHDRRRLLVQGAAMAGVALAPGLTLFELAQGRPPAEPAAKAVRWGMLVDANRCASGCDACVRACATENGLPDVATATSAQWIRKVELKDRAGDRTRSAPVMCQHCAHPPCVDVCPTGASFKRADGIVLVDRHSCIGCRYCMMACPYQARSFVHEPVTGQRPDVPRGKGCVESCTLCVQRIDRDQAPACVEACAAAGHRALVFGNLADPASPVAQALAALATVSLRPDLALDPGVRYAGL